ncbi:hypothetical protein WJ69_08930 [Burkholderia ubonensis]|nr:hypothetical protein WJ69_08930 [Burkholderia ubonensis]KVU48541.1 hypothetical protein WK69_10465 [Burkholderia ubonensis]
MTMPLLRICDDYIARDSLMPLFILARVIFNSGVFIISTLQHRIKIVHRNTFAGQAKASTFVTQPTFSTDMLR